MIDPYAAPKTSSEIPSDAQVRKLRTFWWRAIKFSLAGVIIPLLIGFIGTVVGMLGAFNELSGTGEADPEALANNISVSLFTTMGGMVIAAISLIILIASIIRFITLPKVATLAKQLHQ